VQKISLEHKLANQDFGHEATVNSGLANAIRRLIIVSSLQIDHAFAVVTPAAGMGSSMATH
jgi:hypothetical protein